MKTGKTRKKKKHLGDTEKLITFALKMNTYTFVKEINEVYSA